MTRTKWQLPLCGGDEYDALSGWRKVLKFRPGARKRAKRQYQRRVRRQSKADLKRE